MFGLVQLKEYVEKTGSTSISVDKIMEALGVSRRSAVRYIYEMRRLGLIKPINGRGEYVIDTDRLKLLERLLSGNDIKDVCKQVVLGNGRRYAMVIASDDIRVINDIYILVRNTREGKKADIKFIST